MEKQKQRAADTSFEALTDKLRLANSHSLFGNGYLKYMGGSVAQEEDDADGESEDDTEGAGQVADGLPGPAAWQWPGDGSSPSDDADSDDDAFNELLQSLTGARLAALFGASATDGKGQVVEDGEEPAGMVGTSGRLSAAQEAEDEAFIEARLRALEGRGNSSLLKVAPSLPREDIESALLLNRQLQARLTGLLGQVSNDLEANYQLQLNLTRWKQQQQQQQQQQEDQQPQDTEEAAAEARSARGAELEQYSLYRSSFFWCDGHRMPEPNADIPRLRDVLPLVSVPHTAWKWGQAQKEALKQAVLAEVQNAAAEDILEAGGAESVASLLQQLNTAKGISLETQGVAGVVEQFSLDQWARVVDVAAIENRTPEDVKVFVLQELLPEAVGRPLRGNWGAAELRRLKELVQQHGTHKWEVVGVELGRSAVECLRTWLQRLSPDANKPQRFTSDEDMRLAAAVEKYGTVWKLVGAAVGRNPWACMHRWRENVALQERRKGKWTLQEDEALLQAMRRCGSKNWVAIAEQVAGRTGPQCRERWYNVLNPEINMGEWSQEEVTRLVALVQVHEKSHGRVPWAKLMDQLPGRRDHDLKRTYLRLCRVVEDEAALSEAGWQASPMEVEQLNLRRHTGSATQGRPHARPSRKRPPGYESTTPGTLVASDERMHRRTSRRTDKWERDINWEKRTDQRAGERQAGVNEGSETVGHRKRPSHRETFLENKRRRRDKGGIGYLRVEQEVDTSCPNEVTHGLNENCTLQEPHILTQAAIQTLAAAPGAISGLHGTQSSTPQKSRRNMRKQGELKPAAVNIPLQQEGDTQGHQPIASPVQPQKLPDEEALVLPGTRRGVRQLLVDNCPSQAGEGSVETCDFMMSAAHRHSAVPAPKQQTTPTMPKRRGAGKNKKVATKVESVNDQLDPSVPMWATKQARQARHKSSQPATQRLHAFLAMLHDEGTAVLKQEPAATASRRPAHRKRGHGSK